MPTVNRLAALELDVNYGSGTETARFEMGPLGDAESGGASVEHEIRTELFVDSRGDQLLSFLADAVSSGEAKRQGLSLDLGGGVHAVTINFNSPGATQVNGGPLQWGTSTDTSVRSAKSATGAEDPYLQQAVLINALRIGTFDSAAPARLEVGEFAPGGETSLETLDVVVENPNAVLDAGRARWDGAITLVETQTLDDLGDALERSKLGG